MLRAGSRILRVLLLLRRLDNHRLILRNGRLLVSDDRSEVSSGLQLLDGALSLDSTVDNSEQSSSDGQ